jgi:ABC-type transport system involved in multi-copper enzyme maturation permease subunit
MAPLLAVARATWTGVVNRPLYYVTLLVFGAMISLSPLVTLFQFTKEAQLIREMAVATMTLWGLLLVTVLAGNLVTNELEDRTALLLLSKPLRRSSFLLGKLFGMVWAQAMGVAFLSMVFFLTLWIHQGMDHAERYSTLETGDAWSFLWERHLSRTSAFVAQAGILCVYQLGILSALCLCMAAFFPVIVTISATALLFILGNVSTHFVANLQSSSPGIVSGSAKFLSYLLPNLGYFNLQVHFGEGSPVSLNYLLLAGGYTIIYVGAVIWFASLIFETREVR